MLLFNAISAKKVSYFLLLWPPFWLANPGIYPGTDFIGNSRHCLAGSMQFSRTKKAFVCSRFISNRRHENLVVLGGMIFSFDTFVV